MDVIGANLNMENEAQYRGERVRKRVSCLPLRGYILHTLRVLYSSHTIFSTLLLLHIPHTLRALYSPHFFLLSLYMVGNFKVDFWDEFLEILWVKNMVYGGSNMSGGIFEKVGIFSIDYF